MVALAVIVAAGIFFLLRVLVAFWKEAATQSHRPVPENMDSTVNTSRFIPANRSARLLTFEARLKNAAIASNEAERAEFRSSKRAF